MKRRWIWAIGGKRGARVIAAVLATTVLTGCAAAMLGNASRGGYYGSGTDSRTQAQISEDGALTNAVKSKLSAEASLKGQAVTVETYQGVVTLKGTVQNVEQRATAERLARSVKGVKNVRNELRTR
jgi:hyperosmotically inducible protein